ncbi:MAG: PAS domain-containing protein [Proteobacteria bacterium]|nr:MAG: PAS domain-containing protein [Pseudomonadota bacterium]
MMPTAIAVFQNPGLSQNSPLGVFTMGSDGRILSFNRQAAELWGMNLEGGQSFYYNSFRCFALNGRELGLQENPMATAILRSLPTDESEIIVERPDGRRVIWHLRVEPIMGADKKNLGAVAYFRKKEAHPFPLEATPEEHLPTLIGYVGNDLRFRFANAAHGRWFGLNEPDIVGRALIEVIGADAFAEIAPELRLVLDGSPQEYERFIPTALAGNRFLSLRLVPDSAPGGFVRGMALIGSDVTVGRRQEAERSARQGAIRAQEKPLPRKLLSGIA